MKLKFSPKFLQKCENKIFFSTLPQSSSYKKLAKNVHNLLNYDIAYVAVKSTDTISRLWFTGVRVKNFFIYSIFDKYFFKQPTEM
jgi:hypothetical protein